MVKRCWDHAPAAAKVSARHSLLCGWDAGIYRLGPAGIPTGATGFGKVLRDNQNHARCDNQASLTPASVVQRKLHPGIMMSGRQAAVKPGLLGPRLWRLRA